MNSLLLRVSYGLLSTKYFSDMLFIESCFQKYFTVDRVIMRLMCYHSTCNTKHHIAPNLGLLQYQIHILTT